MPEDNSLDILGTKPLAKAVEKITEKSVDGIGAFFGAICMCVFLPIPFCNSPSRPASNSCPIPTSHSYSSCATDSKKKPVNDARLVFSLRRFFENEEGFRFGVPISGPSAVDSLERQLLHFSNRRSQPSVDVVRSRGSTAGI